MQIKRSTIPILFAFGGNCAETMHATANINLHKRPQKWSTITGRHNGSLRNKAHPDQSAGIACKPILSTYQMQSKLKKMRQKQTTSKICTFARKKCSVDLSGIMYSLNEATLFAQ
jgi:hypothetical protein